jgi:hypothetical protein
MMHQDTIQNDRYIDWEEWLNSCESKKRLLYREAKEIYDNEYRGTTDINKLKKLAAEYKMHTKTDEKVFLDHQSMKRKARCVTEENDLIKVILGPLIKYIAKLCKRSFDWYGSGLSAQDRGIKIEGWIEKIPVHEILCIDGSSFDSTQYGAIMEVFDQVYLKEIIKAHPEIRDYATPEHIHAIVDNLWRVIKADITEHIKITAMIYGTTGSGQMNTSNGNTLRAGSYILYGAYKSGLIYGEDFFFECSGDDTIILIKKEKSKALQDALFKYVYLKSFKENGKLGQVAKVIDKYNTIDQAEYLSSHFMINEIGQVKMYRKLTRFFQLTPFTRSINSYKESTIKLKTQMFALCDYNELKTWMSDIKLFNSVGKLWRKFITVDKNADTSDYISKDSLYNDRSDTRIGFNKAFEESLLKLYSIESSEINDFIQTIEKCKDQFAIIRHTLLDKIYGDTQNKNLIKDCAIVSKFLNNKRERIMSIDETYKGEYMATYDKDHQFNPKHPLLNYIDQTNRNDFLEEALIDDLYSKSNREGLILSDENWIEYELVKLMKIESKDKY